MCPKECLCSRASAQHACSAISEETSEQDLGVQRVSALDPLATQSAGEDEIVVDSVWVAASLKAHGYEVIVDAGEPRESTPASFEPCHAGGSRTSSGTTCTDN
ncbi:hypothetical protein MTO96_041138, partial [Rhipicephalus appendiculatus]